MADIRWVVLRANIIVLHNPCGIEVVNESSMLVMIVNFLNLLDKCTTLSIAVPNRTESIPERYQDNLCMGIDLVNTLYELKIALKIFLVSNVIMSVIVVGAQIDDNNVGRWMFTEIPHFRIVIVDLYRSARRVRRMIPLIGLATGISPAVGVYQADPRISCDEKFNITKTSTKTPSIGRYAFICGILTCLSESPMISIVLE